MAFWNGLLVEEINIEKPDCFSIHRKDDQVYLLTNALYVLQ